MSMRIFWEKTDFRYSIQDDFSLLSLLEKEKEKRAAEIKKLESVQREAIADSQRLYRDANAELVDALLMYDEMDGHEADLLRLIDTWPTATHAAEEETA